MLRSLCIYCSKDFPLLSALLVVLVFLIISSVYINCWCINYVSGISQNKVAFVVKTLSL